MLRLTVIILFLAAIVALFVGGVVSLDSWRGTFTIMFAFFMLAVLSYQHNPTGRLVILAKK